MPDSVPVAVVDANILYQRYPRNLVVWLAVERAFWVVESPQLFDELREHLIERNEDVHGEPRAAAVDRTIDLINEQLELGAGELVPRKRVEERIPDVEANDPDDRHVLAAAVEASADYIVTHNTGDFDPAECARHGVEVVGLDEFLMRLLDAAAERHPERA